MSKNYVLAAGLIVFAFILSGCGRQNLIDKQAESILEKNLGSKAEVEVDNEKINIKTEQGSLQVGGNVKLPENFPKDVYVIEGQLMSAMNNVVGAGYQVVVKSDKTPQQAKAEYEVKLKEMGWKILNSIDMGTASAIMAQKDNRQLTVTMGTEEGRDGLAVIITLVDDQFKVSN